MSADRDVRRLLAIHFAMAFGAGYFFGAIVTGLRLPAYLHGPLLAAMMLGVFLYLQRDGAP